MRKLEIELIPKTSFFDNLRSMLPAEEWDVLRKQCYKDAGYCCQICSGKGEKWPVECHEVWSYDFKKKIQKLERLIALCPACHECKHLGLAQIRGRLSYVKEHLANVNEIDQDEVEEMIDEAWALWKQKNKIQWKLDISEITKK